MAAEKQQALDTVERLLKQGKVQAALAELQRVTQSAPNDLLTLNRLGDLLARQGRHAEAIDYYGRIAERFEQGGFLPKAVAIHKKILRLDPQNVASIIRLGELYVLQRLPGDARSYLLHAADLLLKSHEFERARKVYERLVRIEPDEPRHRVRLAESRVAEGHVEPAVDELLKVADDLFGAGKPLEAEKIYRRCRELAPARSEALHGLARALTEQGRLADAVNLLETAVAAPNCSAQTLGELALRYAMGGRADRALDLLPRPVAAEMPASLAQPLFKLFVQGGQGERAWQRLEPALSAPRRDVQPVALFLEAVAEIEDYGHIPALQRLFELHRKAGDQFSANRAMEWLVRAYQSRSMHDEASLMLDQLRECFPESILLRQAESGDAEPAVPTAREEVVEIATEMAEEPPTVGAQPESGPAVASNGLPVTRADEEFVSGRLTQAEILEKYGLRAQALDQLREVIDRFPHHVAAQERRVLLLRTGAPKARLSEAFCGLALALAAGGEMASARQAAAEAESQAPLTAEARQALCAAGLLSVSSEAKPASIGARTKDEIVIEVEDEATVPGIEPTAHATPHKASAPAPPRRPSRPPSRDMLEEIETFLAAGAAEEAVQRVSALRALGYESPELDALATRAKQPASAVGSSTDLDDDLDLKAITDALEADLLAELGAAPPIVAPEAPDQSLDEIFAAFRQQVSAEVPDEDFATHYDLGIAYKEMGLIDEAIAEFEHVTRHEGLYRQACSMIAICHLDRADLPQAARWYRAALDASCEDADARIGLTYDLADVLLKSGDAEGALDLFRGVQTMQPGYRDVQRRVSQLELQLTL